jgi:alpha-tubulin suppressor-like RCC1 family protein
MKRDRTIRVNKHHQFGVVLAIVLAPLAICLPQAAASSQVMSFGENIWGQLGNEGLAESNPTPTVVTLPGATGSPVQVAVGEDHSVVLTSGGQIYTFGTGGLGSGNRFSEFRTPVAIKLPGATGAPVQAAAGVSFSLVVTASGQLYSFGYDATGQLGDGKTSYEENPTPEAVTLPGATGPPAQVAAGREFSLVLTATGQLYAFGGDSQGELGDGSEHYEGVSIPELITLPGATGPAVQIAAGEYHSLVATSTGQLYTFGNNHSGQLGKGTSDNSAHPTPEAVTLPGATGPVVQVAAGWESSLALTSTGQLYTFGNDEDGQLGNGEANGAPHPTPEAITLPGLTGSIVQIAAGKNHSLVLTSSGQLYAFGSDQYGQLGNGKTEETPYTTPTLVPLPNVTGVALGSSANHVLAILAVPPPPLDVTTTTLPEGKQGTPYTATATATGGTPPLHWSATGLPSGLSIESSSGQISGTPTAPGSSTVTLIATDAEGVRAESAPIALVIAAAACTRHRDHRCGHCSSGRVRCCGRGHGGRAPRHCCKHDSRACSGHPVGIGAGAAVSHSR